MSLRRSPQKITISSEDNEFYICQYDADFRGESKKIVVVVDSYEIREGGSLSSVADEEAMEKYGRWKKRILGEPYFKMTNRESVVIQDSAEDALSSGE